MASKNDKYSKPNGKPIVKRCPAPDTSEGRSRRTNGGRTNGNSATRAA